MPNFITCANKDLTPEQLMAALLTKTAGLGGEVAIRTMLVPACELDAIDCTTNSLPLKTNLSKAIGINSCGKPALRLGIKAADLALSIGAVSYADLTAANTALAAGVIFYNTALAKLDITTA